MKTLTKRVLNEVKTEPTCRRLMTVPGVGPLTALAFRATIDQPGRFRKSRDVGAHLGLTPRRYQSGETDVQGGISRCHSAGPRLPTTFWPASSASACDTPNLRQWGELLVRDTSLSSDQCSTKSFGKSGGGVPASPRPSSTAISMVRTIASSGMPF